MKKLIALLKNNEVLDMAKRVRRAKSIRNAFDNAVNNLEEQNDELQEKHERLLEELAAAKNEGSVYKTQIQKILDNKVAMEENSRYIKAANEVIKELDTEIVIVDEKEE